MSAAPLVLVDDDTPATAIAASPCALVIGNFDGVHRGHQTVLHEAASEARMAGLAVRALTFDPHPARVIGGDAPPLLTSLEDRAELLAGFGVDRVYVRRFDASFAAWSPERFVRELVYGRLAARRVVVGGNFRFGARRGGDLDLLRSLGRQLGFDARVHSVAADARGPFSSTRARDAIAAGNVEEAERVLGRPHAIAGVVAHGDALGRTLGFPTANLEHIAEMVPGFGVYAVRVDVQDGGAFVPLALGVTSIGTRPTVRASAGRATVETFLLDYSDDLYGKRLRLHFVARLRDEARFESLEELKHAIAADVERARAALIACVLPPSALIEAS